MKTTIALSLLLMTIFASPKTRIGIFQDHIDIGKVKITGTSDYNKSTETYTLKGSGGNIWFASDQFQFAYKKLKGDFILTADFEFVGKGTNGHRKTGWMVRASADSDAVHYSGVLHGDGLTVLQWRPTKGVAMLDPENEIFAPEKNYSTIQLERLGNKIIMRAAQKGKELKEIGSTEMQNIPYEVMAGIFICAHDANVLEEAHITNVKIASVRKPY